MASALRILPSPNQYYVAVCLSGQDVSTFTLSSDGITWLAAAREPVTALKREVYRDLGKTILYNPTTGNPPVDLRKVALMSTDGQTGTSQVLYIPLGTRLRGSVTQQQAQYKSCWVALMSTSLASQQFGLRS